MLHLPHIPARNRRCQGKAWISRKPRVLPLSSHPQRPKLGEHAGVEGSLHAMDGQLPAPRSLPR